MKTRELSLDELCNLRNKLEALMQRYGQYPKRKKRLQKKLHAINAQIRRHTEKHKQ